VHLNTAETKTDVLIFYVATIFTEILVDSWSYIYSDNSVLGLLDSAKSGATVEVYSEYYWHSCKLDGYLSVSLMDI